MIQMLKVEKYELWYFDNKKALIFFENLNQHLFEVKKYFFLFS